MPSLSPHRPHPDGEPPGERPDLLLLVIWATFVVGGLATAVWALARSLVA